MILAHGLGGRADLPIPLAFFTWGASIALVVSFVALGALWRRPRLAASSAGRELPGWAQAARRIAGPILRLVGLGLFLLALSAALWGSDSAVTNVAPVLLYVVLWIGGPIVSAVVGDVWRVLNPYDTLAAIGDWAKARRPDPGHWTAAVLLLSFLWMELAYHESDDPRAVGLWLSAYSVAVLAGAAVWGRDWVRRGEGFAGLFGLLAHIAPFFRDDDGTLRLRPPLSGLAQVEVGRGTVPLVMIALGSTTFDGLSRTTWWQDVVGQRQEWSLTAVNTAGLLWTIGMVTVAYLVATRLAARIGSKDPGEMAVAFAPSLLPIALAYAVAHYFSLLVFEGQSAIALLSDPYARGWDLFGTVDHRIDYTVISTDTISWVQAGAIVVGHIAGVVAAHDRAVELWPLRQATRTQYPLLGVMVLYTVAGLALLLGA